ncbi:hypothetical protein [Mycolicibacterium mucogenicum]|uniref:hypothetical protein n=1 Tax=Mycolicibacterium mucogenicum TaxID=56689 RepID=UPI0013A5A624|nr:hypothetical protein [Mycolicibacterium mucogenicum]
MVVVVAVNVVSIAAAAAIAYAVGRDSAPAKSAPPATVSASPNVSDTDSAAAKDKVCQAINAGVRGTAGQGGAVVNGDLNIPFILRKLNTIVAVQNSLSPAVPSDVSDAAKKYVATATDLTTAALAHTPVDQLNELTKSSNASVDAALDACGLPR